MGNVDTNSENSSKPLKIFEPGRHYKAPKVKLAGNPSGRLKYPEKVTLKNGQVIEVASPTATRALVSLMDMQAVMGGAASHFGGPSAFAELMSALHGIVFEKAKSAKREWFEMFHILNDAGHCENGLYALKANYGVADLNIDSLKGFRSIQSPLTGHGESHIFPEGVLLSNGPLGSCFPQSQGLCFADHLLKNDRVTVTAISDGAMMEGESREALAAIPGLAANGKMNPYVLIISDNNTKLSGRIDKDAFSMQNTFDTMEIMGWKVVTLEKGHDLQLCTKTIEEAIEWAQKNPQKPIVIHAKTIKGYGVKKTMDSSSGGHGFPLSDPKDLKLFLEEIYQPEIQKGGSIPKEFLTWAETLVSENEEKKKKKAAKEAEKVAATKEDFSKTTAAITPPKSEKIQVGVSNALTRLRNEGYPIISISSDLAGSTGVAGFQKSCPESTQDIGVAESNMISMAAGASKLGFIPVVDTFAQFGVTKGALPLTMASLSEAPVIAFFSHTGFQDAADGASHQALTYLSKTCSIPNTDVYALTCSEEADVLVELAVKDFADKRSKGETPNSKIFFLGRENFPATYGADKKNFQLDSGQVIFDNTDVYPGKATIVAGGSMLMNAIQAAYELDAKKIGVVVVNPCILNKPDVNLLRTCLRNTEGRIVTVEDHQLIGGMGAIIAHSLSLNNVPYQMKSLGVHGEFGQSAYTAQELYAKHKLDSVAITKTVQAF
jgi:transketolase